MFLKRPPSFRNAVWEADHVEAAVQVEVDGRSVTPWVSRFVDAAFFSGFGSVSGELVGNQLVG